eukprot:CAMPEP_0172662188 /NCGR_PEP_ID=MMETSP1074-20121228/5204_1 /TAXON_ID=2916 /ORGANISM="Ceratium fusus, Strain PA161109" /LENGTH=423 /DNA_ID=CAMNT_0013478067 /DNA_START=37 /DNA_END=1309 /DNA_ORIENTATION=-
MTRLSHAQPVNKKVEAPTIAEGSRGGRSLLACLLEEHVELVALLGGKTMATGIKAHKEQLCGKLRRQLREMDAAATLCRHAALIEEIGTQTRQALGQPPRKAVGETPQNNTAGSSQRTLGRHASEPEREPIDAGPATAQPHGLTTSKAATLPAEIKQLEAKFAALAKQHAGMDKIHQEQNAAFVKASADITAGWTGVRQALTAFRGSYASEAALVHQPAMPELHPTATGSTSTSDSPGEVEVDLATNLAKEETHKDDTQANKEANHKVHEPMKAGGKTHEQQRQQQQQSKADVAFAAICKKGSEVAGNHCPLALPEPNQRAAISLGGSGSDEGRQTTLELRKEAEPKNHEPNPEGIFQHDAQRHSIKTMGNYRQQFPKLELNQKNSAVEQVTQMLEQQVLRKDSCQKLVPADDCSQIVSKAHV